MEGGPDDRNDEDLHGAGHELRPLQAGGLRRLEGLPGVTKVEVDLATKLVVVEGADLDDGALRAAIEEAGYEVA